jgi:hypothetical protein
MRSPLYFLCRIKKKEDFLREFIYRLKPVDFFRHARLKRLFEDGERLVGNSLPFHVVHVAGNHKEDQYRELLPEAHQICFGATAHKPYYEIVPRKPARNVAHLVFVPQDLAEAVAELHPDPRPIAIYSVLCKPSRMQM